MIESLVITLREGMEAALVVGIILAYLKKTGREHQGRSVYLGLGLAVLASLGVAVLLSLLNFDPENEYLEGALLTVAAIFVASMVVWMMRTARNIRGHIEGRVGGMALGSGWAAGLIAFTFFMAFREGVEMVLFLGAASIGQEASLVQLLGGALGLGMAIFFAFLFIRGSLRINLGRFFTVTGVVLLLLALKLFLGGIHEFAEVGVLPMSAGIMKAIGYFVRDSSSLVIMMGLVALPLVVVLWGVPAPAPATAEAAPQRRKRLAQARREGLWRVGLVLATLAILFALGSSALAGSDRVDPPPQPVSATSGEIALPLASLEEGRLYKFIHTVTGARFLVTRLPGGETITALDACQICGTVGYAQEGQLAICKNCNAPIPMHTLGLGGGCNPLPLASRVQGDSLVIPVVGLDNWPH